MGSIVCSYFSDGKMSKDGSTSKILTEPISRLALLRVPRDVSCL